MQWLQSEAERNGTRGLRREPQEEKVMTTTTVAQKAQALGGRDHSPRRSQTPGDTHLKESGCCGPRLSRRQ